LSPKDPMHFQLARRHAFNEADLIIIVGTPFDFRMGYGKRLSPAAKVVQIDLNYGTVGKNRDIDLGIVGDAGPVLAAVTSKSPGHWMDPGPLGTLGVGIPFVLAAKHARPDKEIVALFGDGAFSLTGWDFETLVRFNLPFVGIVGNNSSMNQIRYGQIQKYGE